MSATAEETDVGKDWLFDINQSTLLCDRFWTTFGTIFCFVTLIFIIWRNNKSASIKGENKLNSKIWYATLAAIISFGLNELSLMFITFPWFYRVSANICDILIVINLWLYFGSKFFLWLYNIVRLYDVFHESGTLKYNTTFLKGLVLFFALEVVFICILARTANKYIQHNGLCVVVAADYIPPAIALIDICSNILCLWLFFAKMRKLWKMVTAISDDITSKTVELAYIIRKFTVLTAFSVCSTILLGASVAVTPIFYTMLTFDCIINVVCLVLFDKRFDCIYQTLCCCCSKRIKFDEIIKKIKFKNTNTNKNANTYGVVADNTADTKLELGKASRTAAKVSGTHTAPPYAHNVAVSYDLTATGTATANTNVQTNLTKTQQLSVVGTAAEDIEISANGSKSGPSSDNYAIENTVTPSHS